MKHYKEEPKGKRPILIVIVLIIGALVALYFMFGDKIFNKDNADNVSTLSSAASEVEKDNLSSEEIEQKSSSNISSENSAIIATGNNNVSSVASDDKISTDELIKMLEQTLAVDFKQENLAIEYEEGTGSIVINVWMDGLANEMELLYMTETFQDSWKSISSNMSALSTTVKKLIEKYHSSDTNAVINVLNDLNKENALLMIINGAVAYDQLDILNS